MKIIWILPVILLFCHKVKFSSGLNTKGLLEKPDLSREDITNGVDEGLPKEDITNGADKDLPKEVITNGADKDLPKEDFTNGADEGLPKEVITNGADKDLPKEDITNGADEDLPKLVHTIRTKGRKRTAGCEQDKSSNCDDWKRDGHCTDSKYEASMKISCDTTCNCPIKTLTSEEYDEVAGSAENVKVLTRATLGRSAALGDLYDAHTDQFVPGFTLWSPEQMLLEKETIWHPSSSLLMGVAISDKEKHSTLNVDANLRFSKNLGLAKIDAYGSAKYLDHSEDHDKNAQITVHYKSITRTEVLSSNLVDNVDGNSQGCQWVKQANAAKGQSGTNPTHVVTSVTFGGNAHFVFEQESKKKETKQQISGRLEAGIKSIFGTKRVSTDFNDYYYDHDIFSDLKITLYSDFILLTEPRNLEETMEAYEQIATYLGDKDNGFIYSVPMTVVLIPIVKFCPEENAVSVEISEQMMEDAVEIKQQLLSVMSKTQKLLNSMAANALAVQEVLSDFYSEIKTYEMEYSTHLGEAIIEERSGVKENVISNLILDHRNSNYHHTDFLLPYLMERKREVYVINDFYIETVSTNGLKLQVYDEASIPRAIIDQKKVFILTLDVLPDLEQESFKNFATFDDDAVSLWKANKWYNNNSLVGRIGSLRRIFREFFAANSYQVGTQYFVKLERFDSTADNTASSMARGQLFLDGEEVDGFKIPPAAKVSSDGLNPVACRSNKEVTITLQNPSNNEKGASQIINFYITYYINDEFEDPVKTLSIPVVFSSTETSFTISDLVKEHNYNISIAYNTEYALGAAATIEVIGTIDEMSKTEGCFIEKDIWYTNAIVQEDKKSAKECAQQVVEVSSSSRAIWIYEYTTFSCLSIDPADPSSSDAMKIISPGWASGTQTCATADDVIMNEAACPVPSPQESGSEKKY